MGGKLSQVNWNRCMRFINEAALRGFWVRQKDAMRQVCEADMLEQLGDKYVEWGAVRQLKWGALGGSGDAEGEGSPAVWGKAMKVRQARILRDSGEMRQQRWGWRHDVRRLMWGWRGEVDEYVSRNSNTCAHKKVYIYTLLAFISHNIPVRQRRRGESDMLEQVILSWWVSCFPSWRKIVHRPLRWHHFSASTN